MTIKSIIAIVTLAISIAASAQVATLQNKAGGSIVLTSKASSECEPSQRIAYSTNPDGGTVFGCWFNDEVMVHIDWRGGEFRSYPIGAFVMEGGE